MGAAAVGGPGCVGCRSCRSLTGAARSRLAPNAGGGEQAQCQHDETPHSAHEGRILLWGHVRHGRPGPVRVTLSGVPLGVTMRRITQTLLIALLGAAAVPVFVMTPQGQSILGPPSEANHFIATPKGWVHPKTPWGEPDIQANLNMMQAAGIPLERCANATRFGGPPCDMNKAFWTEAEFKQRVAAASGRGDPGRQLIEKGEYGRALLSGVTDPSTPQRQTTLIVDPPNGVMPALTPEGKRRALAMRSGWSLPGESPAYDSVTDFDSWDRCITRGMPSSMMPYRYNGGFRIWQAPGVVVFDLEMIHDTRVIFTDGRPPLPSAHKQYMGESRGRWERNALVVETTNYKGGLAPIINLAVVG